MERWGAERESERKTQERLSFTELENHLVVRSANSTAHRLNLNWKHLKWTNGKVLDYDVES